MRTTRAVILARGLGTRMRAPDSRVVLTERQRRAADAGSKSMLPIAGRPFLDYLLSEIADAGIGRVALIVPPVHEDISRHYRVDAVPARLQVDFLVQEEPRGTADAVLAAERWANHHPFLVMNADNLYPKRVLSDLAVLDEPGLPVFERGDLVRSGNIPEERVASFALVEVDRRGYLTAIVEKPAAPTAADDRGLVSMNCWRFDNRIFAACRDVEESPRGESELPLAVALAVARGVAFKAVPARGPVLDLSTRGDAATVARLLGDAVPRP